MKTLKTQKGITLIALIITIIVMLILVGVSVNIALGNGLFKAAQSGAANTELEKQKETELSSGQVTIGNKTYSSIESYVAGNAGMPAGVKVGDYISNYDPTPQYNNGTNYKVEAYSSSGVDSDQFFTEDESLGWRILSIDETTGKIALISDNATADTLILKGYDSGATGNTDMDVTCASKLCASLYSSEGIGNARTANRNEIPEELRKCNFSYWIWKVKFYPSESPDGGPPYHNYYFYIVDSNGEQDEIGGQLYYESVSAPVRPVVDLVSGVTLEKDVTPTGKTGTYWKIVK